MSAVQFGAPTLSKRSPPTLSKRSPPSTPARTEQRVDKDEFFRPFAMLKPNGENVTEVVVFHELLAKGTKTASLGLDAPTIQMPALPIIPLSRFEDLIGRAAKVRNIKSGVFYCFGGIEVSTRENAVDYDGPEHTALVSAKIVNDRGEVKYESRVMAFSVTDVDWPPFKQ